MIKPLDLAIMLIEGKICLHPAILIEHKEQDIFENYQNLCEWNGHDVASSEIGAYDKKE